MADAWFGNKPTLRMTEENSWYKTFNNGKVLQQMLTAVELYQSAVQKQWEKIEGTTYQAKTLDVEQNLAKKKSAPDGWITVLKYFFYTSATT